MESRCWLHAATVPVLTTQDYLLEQGSQPVHPEIRQYHISGQDHPTRLPFVMGAEPS